MPTADQDRDPDGWWAAAVVSVSFLTVLSTPRIDVTPARLARAIAFFPLVGMALGAAIGALGLLLERVLPADPAAVLLVACGVVLTRALHLDGLIDTADGVFGGDTPERRLEIMRDSRIGAFGAVAGGVILLAQYACLSALAGTARLTALILAFGLSRWLMAAAIVLFPPARSSGLGASFQRGASAWLLAVATASAAVLAFLLRPQGVVGFVAVAPVLALGGWFLTRRLGGLTGDSYGALGILAETAVLYGVLLTAGAIGEAG